MKKRVKIVTNVSRQQMRHAKVKINGKEVKVIEYLKKQAHLLPPMLDEHNNRVDHEFQLIDFYL